MGALREPKLLKLEVRTPQNMVLYSKSATTSLSNICYDCIGSQSQPLCQAAAPKDPGYFLLESHFRVKAHLN